MYYNIRLSAVRISHKNVRKIDIRSGNSKDFNMAKQKSILCEAPLE